MIHSGACRRRRSPRRRAWRAMLSALAGGGLTAAGLGGPLAGRSARVRGAGRHDELPGNLVDAGDDALTRAAQEAAAGEPSNTTSTTPSSPPSLERPARRHASRRPGLRRARPRKLPPWCFSAGRRRPRSSEPSTRPRRPSRRAAKPQDGRHRSAQEWHGSRAQQRGAPAAAGGRAGRGARGGARVLGGIRAGARLLPHPAVPASRSTRRPLSSTACPGRSSPRSTKSRPTTAPTSRCRPPAPSGWMQFMPATWLQYGVDAAERGLRRPLQPGGRDLRRRTLPARRRRRDEPARGDPRLQPLRGIRRLGAPARQADLHLSEVRDRDAHRPRRRSPARDRARIAWGSPLAAALPSPRARPPTPSPSRASAAAGSTGVATGAEIAAAPATRSATPGSSAPPSPATPRRSQRAGQRGAQAPQLVELLSAPNAAVVAVQDGRIVELGSSRKLGKYVILRDVYGDVFTYAGLGSIAPSYRLPKAPHGAGQGAARRTPRARHEPTPSAAGERGTPASADAAASRRRPARRSGQGHGRRRQLRRGGLERIGARRHGQGAPVRPPRQPGRARRRRERRAQDRAGARRGRRRPSAAAARIGRRRGHRARSRATCRAAPATATCASRSVRPATRARSTLARSSRTGSSSRPRFTRRARRANRSLLGATASEVLLFQEPARARGPVRSRHHHVGLLPPRSRLRGDRQARAGGARVPLAQRPEADGGHAALRRGAYAVSGYVPADHIGDAVAITQINGIPIAGHQGPGSITDTTIRTLLTLPRRVRPASDRQPDAVPGCAAARSRGPTTAATSRSSSRRRHRSAPPARRRLRRRPRPPTRPARADGPLAARGRAAN